MAIYESTISSNSLPKTRQDNAECAYQHFHYANELILHDYETKIYLLVRKHPRIPDELCESCANI